MLLDLIDFSKLRRAVVYGLLLLLVFAVQKLFLSCIPLFGVHPLVIPAVVVAIALFDGGLWGGFMGLVAGYFLDMGYTEHTVLFTILLPSIGFFAGVLGKYLLHRGFLSFLSLFIAALAIITFCQMFRFLVFTDTAVWPVWRTGLLQLLWSIPWAIPVYFPCKSIAGRM